MKNMLKTAVATALCAMSLCALAAPRAHAAGTVVTTGKITGKPRLWISGIDGAKNTDATKAVQQWTTALTGTQWDVMDDSTIVISKSGKQVVPTLGFRVDYDANSGHVYAPHLLGSDGTHLDGMILAASDSATPSWAILWIRQPAQGGGSSTLYVEVDLAFAAASGQ